MSTLMITESNALIDGSRLEQASLALTERLWAKPVPVDISVPLMVAGIDAAGPRTEHGDVRVLPQVIADDKAPFFFYALDALVPFIKAAYPDRVATIVVVRDQDVPRIYRFDGGILIRQPGYHLSEGALLPYAAAEKVAGSKPSQDQEGMTP